MRLVWQWIELERELPPTWAEIRVSLTVPAAQRDRAAALLGGANPLRRGDQLRLFISRRGGFGPEAFRRALLRLDRQGVGGTLELEHLTEAEPEAIPEARTLAAQWDAMTANLPPDWSDVHGEVRLDSTDYLEPGALALAPVNPSRVAGAVGFRFRCARRFGYGAAPEMVRRCLERLEDAGITGRVRILRALSDTKPVATQGPVWYVAGKSV